MTSTTRGYRLKEGTYDYEKQDTMKNLSFNSQIPLRFRSEETDEKILSQEVLTTESKKTLATTERRPRTKRNKILPTSGWEIESPTRSQDTEILRDFKATTINGNENNEASGSVGDLKAILSVGGATQSVISVNEDFADKSFLIGGADNVTRRTKSNRFCKNIQGSKY